MEERKKRRDNFLMRKMDDCVDSPFPAAGADGRKFAENPRDSKSDARKMHAYALRREIGRVSLSRRVDPRYSLPSISLFTSVSS